MVSWVTIHVYLKDSNLRKPCQHIRKKVESCRNQSFQLLPIKLLDAGQSATVGLFNSSEYSKHQPDDI